MNIRTVQQSKGIDWYVLFRQVGQAASIAQLIKSIA